MRNDLLAVAREHWQELGDLWRPRHLVAMVSGGPDSMALLDVLQRWQREIRCAVEVAHINYGLRPEAAAETALVQKWGTDHGLKVNTLMVRNLAGCGGNLQATARRIRWEFAHHVLRPHDLRRSAVVLGHQADDQVETVLLHMIRGTGLAGLGGMRCCTRIDGLLVWRPLLTVGREEIVAYLQERDIPFCQDSSNDEDKYSRNLLRHRFHDAARAINPSYRKHFLDIAGKARDCHGLMMANSLRRVTAAHREEGWFEVAVDTLRGYQQMERYYWWQALCDQLRCASRCTAARLRELDRFVFGAAVRWEGWEGLAAEKNRGRLYVFRKKRTAPPREIEVKLAGREELPGWDAYIETTDIAVLPARVPADTVVFDRRALRGRWKIRVRRQGDRFRPFGLQGHSQKIKDFLQSCRVPRFRRDHVPLLIDTGRNEIIWVVGYRPAHGVGVAPSPGRLCQVRFIAHNN